MGEQFRKNSAGVRNMSLKTNAHFNRGRSSNCASHLQTEGKNSAISLVDSSSKESRLGFNKMHQNQLHQENVKTKRKLQVKDMPAIENLHISKIEKGMKKIGKVHAVVDKLVIVKALEDAQQLELDSVLFLSSGNPLGQIFEKFGKHEPFYCIRFKNSEHIKSKGIAVDDEVFFVPDKIDATAPAVEETAKKLNNSDTPSTSQNEALQKKPVAFDDGGKDGRVKQKKEVPVVSLKVLTNGTNGVAVYIPPCSSASAGNGAYSALPKPVQSSAVRFVTDMQQNSHSNPFSSFPNVPLLPTPPVFRPLFPNYLFIPPPCQFPSTFGGIPAQNSLEMQFPTSTPVPFPQVQQNMIPQANALFASSVMNCRQPNLLGQMSGLGATSASLQFPVSSHSPVSTSVPLLLPAGVNSTNINPFLNPQMNFAQHGNPSLPLPAAPPVKSLQWFQGHSIRKTK